MINNKLRDGRSAALLDLKLYLNWRLNGHLEDCMGLATLRERDALDWISIPIKYCSQALGVIGLIFTKDTVANSRLSPKFAGVSLFAR